MQSQRLTSLNLAGWKTRGELTLEFKAQDHLLAGFSLAQPFALSMPSVD